MPFASLSGAAAISLPARRRARSRRNAIVTRAAAAAVASAALLGSAPASAESLATSASSAGSSASSAGSASLRGSSDSIRSSGDSSRGGNAVAEGDYRVAEVAAADARPGTLRVAMQPEPGTAAGAAFDLYLPQQALNGRPLRAGELVSARHRPYGLEFARRDTGEPFFLVLADAWQHDLQTRPLTE